MSAVHAPLTILPLALNGVTYAAGKIAILENISFELEAGLRTVILGPNGAGKSTLLRICHGLLQPTGGTVAWRGRHPEPRRRQAMVFQRPVMLRRSARENIAYALALAGMGSSDRAAQAEKALERAGLAALADRPARVLSVGEQQRLALARAWALRPEVLFLDEPTASLDPAATRAVETAIAAIHAGGTKIVMTTHNLGQARRIADEILFIDRGRLVERTSADEFFRAPRSLEAAEFLHDELAR